MVFSCIFQLKVMAVIINVFMEFVIKLQDDVMEMLLQSSDYVGVSPDKFLNEIFINEIDNLS